MKKRTEVKERRRLGGWGNLFLESFLSQHPVVVVKILFSLPYHDREKKR